MLPYVAIGTCVVVGFLRFGAPGAIGGLILGYLLNLAIGALLLRFRGGFVPRSECRRVAMNFVRVKGALAHAAFGGADEASTVKAVEEQIQRIFGTSVEMAGYPASPDVALDRTSIRAAALQLAETESESSPTRGEALYQLVLQIQLDMYNYDETAAGPPYIHDPRLTAFERRRLLAKPADSHPTPRPPAPDDRD